MEDYKNVLVAIDLSDYSKKTLQKALRIAEKLAAQVHLVTVIDDLPLPVFPFVEQEDFIHQIRDSAKVQMHAIANEFKIPAERVYIESGSAKVGILEKADTINADLIVVGSHGKHGWTNILGSTAASIANSADRDVIVLHVEQ